eukprot:5414968-Prymnesium_polylepis.1
MAACPRISLSFAQLQTLRAQVSAASLCPGPPSPAPPQPPPSPPAPPAAPPPPPDLGGLIAGIAVGGAVGLAALGSAAF